MKNIPESLRQARRNLSCLPEYIRISDWQWDDTKKIFYLHFAIRLSRFSENIPEVTEWYATAAENYPSGNIRIYPSSQNGITDTFAHQACNAFIDSSGLWRSGDLCLSSISAALRKSSFDKAPTGATRRLYWYINRTIRWLYSAVDETLVSKSDLFESPDFSICPHVPFCAVYNEDSTSFMNWSNENESDGRSGIVDYICEPKKNTVYLLPMQYLSFDDTFCFSPAWGTAYPKVPEKNHRKGLWILLKHIPVVNIWQAPVTLHDLCLCCQSDGIDLMRELEKFAPFCRDGLAHPVSIGFPIPKTVGGPNQEITWKTFMLPVLSYMKNHSTLGVRRGFRFNEAGWLVNDRITILVQSMKLQWIYSENWNRSSICSRGHLSEKMQYQHVLIIGCGSLGSSIAEILARSASYKITCLDYDILTAGNLCRHVLTAKSLSCHKASALAERIKDISPCIEVNDICRPLEMSSSSQPSIDFSPYDIIIDTTGEDSILEILGSIRYKKKKIFASCSIGLGAKHLYLSAQKSHQPDFSTFRSMIDSYCQEDISSYDVMELPRDGIGCWHPLFPARSDDMWLAAATSVKTLEQFITNPSLTQASVIYEQKYTSFVFDGYHAIKIQSF